MSLHPYHMVLEKKNTLIMFVLEAVKQVFGLSMARQGCS